MKKLFKPFMVAAAFAGLMTVSSCTKTCDEGFEGDDCKTEIRAKYVGAFTGTEECTTGNSIITITYDDQSSDVTKVSIQNLYGAGFVSEGTLQSDGSINIATQTFGTGSISGTVNISGGKISATYVVTASGVSDNCTWTQN